MKKYYYLYIYTIDITGEYNIISGNLFFDINMAINNAEQWINIPGYHAIIKENNNIIFDK